MVHVKVLLPLGWTAVLLTRIQVLLSICDLRVSMCLCRQMSCHRGTAHGSSGVSNHSCSDGEANGIGVFKGERIC